MSCTIVFSVDFMWITHKTALHSFTAVLSLSTYVWVTCRSASLCLKKHFPFLTARPCYIKNELNDQRKQQTNKLCSVFSISAEPWKSILHGSTASISCTTVASREISYSLCHEKRWEKSETKHTCQHLSIMMWDVLTGSHLWSKVVTRLNYPRMCLW